MTAARVPVPARPAGPPSARVICVVGARPNFMKVKPVMDALAERGAQVILVHTGQHYDPSMSDVFFTDLRIGSPTTSSVWARAVTPPRRAG